MSGLINRDIATTPSFVASSTYFQLSLCIVAGQPFFGSLITARPLPLIEEIDAAADIAILQEFPSWSWAETV
jgi:hypothetical protein